MFLQEIIDDFQSQLPNNTPKSVVTSYYVSRHHFDSIKHELIATLNGKKTADKVRKRALEKSETILFSVSNYKVSITYYV